jgi:hypothetical protein
MERQKGDRQREGAEGLNSSHRELRQDHIPWRWGETPGLPLHCPQLALKPWACAARGFSRPRPPSQQPHLHLTQQQPPGRFLLLGVAAPQASSPSAESSPSVARDGGATGQDPPGSQSGPHPPFRSLLSPPGTSGEGRLVVTPSSGRSNSMGPRMARRCRAITRCCSRLQWFSRDRMTGYGDA